MDKNYTYTSISELSRLIREQIISPVAVVSTALKRIEKLNPELNAFITVLADKALEQAKEAAAEIKAGKWRGPLHGIPVGIKDFYDTAGIKTTAAFEFFKERVPVKDAIGVAKLKEAGAIIIGKTNMHKLGMGTTGLDSYFGPVLNPWNANYIPGGSSAGSAAAVASGLCYATLDTDAIGSCRLPAACCAAVGFKGTNGLISTQGILEGEQAPDEMIAWFSTPGITTRSVADTALVLNVLAERSQQVQTNDFSKALTSGRKLRIAVANNFPPVREISTVFSKAIETIGSLGHPIWSMIAPFGNPFQGISHIEADRKSIAGLAFKDIDVYLSPTMTATVPTITEAGANPQALSPENTAFANYYGLPAISVPCGFDGDGLPLGLQIVAKPWDELAVLQLAHQYQLANKSSGQHPIL